MYTIEEKLREQMADETHDLVPRVTFAQVRARAGRRRRRNLVTVAGAALLPLLAAGAVAAVQPGGSSTPPPLGPTIEPTTIVPLPDESTGSYSGPVVDTGIDVGDDQRLVLWYQDSMNGIESGLRDKDTGRIRRLDLQAMPNSGFSTISEIDDRHGHIVDYGVFGAPDASVDATAAGQTAHATTTRMDALPQATVFWVERPGVLVVMPSGGTNAPSQGAVFTARNAAGVALGTSDDIWRSDSTVNVLDGALIGDWMHTGIALAAGGKLVFWFSGDQDTTLLHAGSDNGAGTVTELTVVGYFERRPFDTGFFGLRYNFQQAVGGTATVGLYIGPAATVAMRATGSTGGGSVTWSAYPRVRICWATGVTGTVTGESRDAQGNVLDNTKPIRAVNVS